MGCTISLEFFGSLPELTRVCVEWMGSPPLVSVRGKSSGALVASGTFQWTSGVKALCLMFTRAALEAQPQGGASIAGSVGSPAASLDYALSKQPLWMLDMFGVDSLGRAQLRRILKRTNPDRKLPGPVTIAVAQRLLPPDRLAISWDGCGLTTEQEKLEFLAALEASVNRSATIVQEIAYCAYEPIRRCA